MYISTDVFSCVLLLDFAVKTKSSSFKYLCLNVACQRDDCVLVFPLELLEDYTEELLSHLGDNSHQHGS